MDRFNKIMGGCSTLDNILGVVFIMVFLAFAAMIFTIALQDKGIIPNDFPCNLFRRPPR